jgi:hypothetical protein
MLHATYKNLAAYAPATAGNVTVVAAGGVKGEPKTVCVLAVADTGLEDKAFDVHYSCSSSLSLLALGGRYLAVGFESNNKMLRLYDITTPSKKTAVDLKYPAEVLQLCLNQRYAAVLLATSPPQVVLHALEEEAHLRRENKLSIVLGLNRAGLEQWFGIGKCLILSCGELCKVTFFLFPVPSLR